MRDGACRMTLQERFDLVRSVGEECIQVRTPPPPLHRPYACTRI
jgi:hypothetical protein